MCTVTKYMLLCTAATFSYCFVVTIFLFQFWPELYIPCNAGGRSNENRGVNLNGSTNRLALCPVDPPNLRGHLDVRKIIESGPVGESYIVHSHMELSVGGQWSPPHCTARHKVALIVPFRDRQTHLTQLLSFLIPILQRQLLDFRFIVTEQYGNGLFNKGRIMNAAFRVAERLGVDCVIFHDVDMLPQDDRISYTCPDQPRHLGAYVDVLGYVLWYHYYTGGVLAIRMEHFRMVNGFSNLFWGWGGEDDNLGLRIWANNMTILRLPEALNYTMLHHEKRQYAMKDKDISKLIETAAIRFPYDGLNKTEWSIVELIPKPLYLHLYVDVGQAPNVDTVSKSMWL